MSDAKARNLIRQEWRRFSSGLGMGRFKRSWNIEIDPVKYGNRWFRITDQRTGNEPSQGNPKIPWGFTRGRIHIETKEVRFSGQSATERLTRQGTTSAERAHGSGY
jgi:hypothetical protein